MLITAHSISGAVVGEAVANPAVAFFLGIVIHYVLDFIPHYDTTDEGVYTPRQVALIVVDASLGLCLLAYMYLFSNFEASFLFGALGGIFPDILDNSPFWSEKLRKAKFFSKVYDFHSRLQNFSVGPFLGILTQVAVVVLFVFIFFQAVVK